MVPAAGRAKRRCAKRSSCPCRARCNRCTGASCIRTSCSAWRRARRGLSLGKALDVFTANLWLVRGEALEALGRDSEAAASYYAALEIDNALLQGVLGLRDAGQP
jgi:hypothetical protein